MKTFTWNDIQNFLNSGKTDPFFAQGTGISVGSFDGLHKGHRTLLSALMSNCKVNNLLSGVLTFTRPLPSIKHNNDYSGDVSTLDQRLHLFEQLGLDFAIVVDFTQDFAAMSGSDFFTVLIKACNMKLLAEGVDFRCGYKGSTDAQAIRYFAEKNNLKVVFVNPVYYKEGTAEEERVSSSYIRKMIQKGFFSTVEELLERKYQLDLPGTETTILKAQISQVLPPPGIMHCHTPAGEDIRLEVTSDKLILSSAAAQILF